MQVPVLAFAATAVPGDDGRRGRAVRDEGSDARGRPDGRDHLERRASGRHRRRPARRRRAAAVEGFRRNAARVRRIEILAAPRAPAPQSRTTSGISSTPPRRSRSCGCTGRRSTRRCRRRRDRQPVGARRPPRRRHRRQRPARSRPAAAARPLVRAVRAVDRRRAGRRRAAVRRSGGAARRPDDLPLRPAVADDRGVRVARPRPHPAVSQRDAGGVLRTVRRRTCSAWPRSAGKSWPRSSGRVDLALGDSDYNRQELESLGFAPTGVFPIAVDTGRVTRRVNRPALEGDPGRRAGELSVRRAGSRRTRRSKTTSAWPSTTNAMSMPTTGSSSSAGSTSCRDIIR